MKPGETSVGPPGSPRLPQFQGFAKGVEGIRQTAVLQTEIALDLGGDAKFVATGSLRKKENFEWEILCSWWIYIYI